MIKNDLQRGLEQDAQRITERMPEEMTDKEIKRIAGVLRKFLVDENMTGASVARALGVSTSQMSQFLKGTYKGKAKELAGKVIDLINSLEAKKRQNADRKGFVRTTVAEKIGALIKNTDSFSRDEGKIGLIIGDAGHGKSLCLRQYASVHKNTIYVELDDAMTSTLIFAEIAEKIKLDSSGSLAMITRRLIEALQNRQLIIMLDEASGLTVKQLNQLRQIVAVKSRCPLILAGNRGLYNKVMQSPNDFGHESLDQFTSRLVRILDLDKLAGEKDGGLYTADDIRKLYEFGGVKLVSGAVKTLRKICRSSKSGRLRTCDNIVSLLHTTRDVFDSKTITAKMITTAIIKLDSPVKLPLAIPDAVDAAEAEAVAAAG